MRGSYPLYWLVTHFQLSPDRNLRYQVIPIMSPKPYNLTSRNRNPAHAMPCHERLRPQQNSTSLLFHHPSHSKACKHASLGTHNITYPSTNQNCNHPSIHILQSRHQKPLLGKKRILYHYKLRPGPNSFIGLNGIKSRLLFDTGPSALPAYEYHLLPHRHGRNPDEKPNEGTPRVRFPSPE